VQTAIAPAIAPAHSWTQYIRVTSVLFWAVHGAALLGVLYCGWSWHGLELAVASYFVRMFVVTAAYHRYFAHRSFKTSRWFQLLLALGAQSAAQKGVLWWASHHRWHHKYSDTPRDVHSAKLRGFWHSHIGWIVGEDWNETDTALVSDLAKYPELRFLDHASVALLPTVALGLAFLFIGGVQGLVWGFFVPTVLLWHGSFSINSLAHMFGRRPYATTDDSRNNWWLAILTNGEGWHNNHHHYQSSAKQGFHWWQIDVTYYLLRLLAACGVIWDLRRPPAEVVAQLKT
jgi:stearoyl-CoA desaturase (Delta-9 desaturase)